MLYMGRRGNKAEVNDGGRIIRLPFEGDGKPPEPGQRVQATKNDCCCPEAIPTDQKKPPKKPHKPPRRDSNKVDIVPYASTNRCVGCAGGEIGGFSYIKAAFKEREVDYPIIDFTVLIGKKYKLLLTPEDTPVLPTPKFWVEWDTFTNKFKLVQLPAKIKKLYLWENISFGSVGLDILSNGSGWSGDVASVTKKINPKLNAETLATPIPNSKDLEIEYWVMDCNRQAWYRAYAVDDGIYDPDPVVTPGDRFITRFTTNFHPKGKIFRTFHYESRLDVFSKWYNDPEDPQYFTYERLY